MICRGLTNCSFTRTGCTSYVFVDVEVAAAKPSFDNESKLVLITNQCARSALSREPLALYKTSSL